VARFFHYIPRGRGTRTNSGDELRVKTHSGDQTRNLLGANRSS
jgi:hypothetical protein